MEITSYSQHLEDCIIAEFFDGKHDGYFVEIGAFDGIYLSNSYAFEQLGWQGICVEAHPQYFDLCQQNRPKSICIHAGCVGDEQITETSFSIEPLGVFSGVNVEMAKVQDSYKWRGLEFKPLEEITVPAFTLNKIFETHLDSNQEIDFISIDIEGTELDVLRGLDFERFKPRLFIIEANQDQPLNALIEFMASKSYFVARKLSVNYIFASSAEDIAKISTIQANCQPADIPHPYQAEMDKQKQKPSIVKRALLRLASYF